MFECRYWSVATRTESTSRYSHSRWLPCYRWSLFNVGTQIQNHRVSVFWCKVKRGVYVCVHAAWPWAHIVIFDWSVLLINERMKRSELRLAPAELGSEGGHAGLTGATATISWSLEVRIETDDRKKVGMDRWMMYWDLWSRLIPPWLLEYSSQVWISSLKHQTTS